MNGKMPNVKNHVKHYMQQTVEAGMNTAKKVDAIFKKVSYDFHKIHRN